MLLSVRIGSVQQESGQYARRTQMLPLALARCDTAEVIASHCYDRFAMLSSWLLPVHDAILLVVKRKLSRSGGQDRKGHARMSRSMKRFDYAAFLFSDSA